MKVFYPFTFPPVLLFNNTSCAPPSDIEVEETNLEDLILLGEDKLINVVIEYPTENGRVTAKAKIKQLTIIGIACHVRHSRTYSRWSP